MTDERRKRRHQGRGHVEIEGVFTHFSKADEEDKEYSKRQVDLFQRALIKFKERNVGLRFVHSSNSAGTMDQNLIYPNDFFDRSNKSTILSRLGISLYGLSPSKEMINKEGIELKAAMSWKTRIVHVKSLQPGEKISYGGTFVTQRRPHTVIATLPVGYADGFRRLLSGPDAMKDKWHVLVRGVRCPVVGRVCMDMTMIDVSALDADRPVKEGEEVVLMGSQGSEVISCDDFASRLQTINYEITCLVGKRVPRVYVSGGEWIASQSFDKLTLSSSFLSSSS